MSVASAANGLFDDQSMAQEDRFFRGPLFVLTILLGSFLLFLVQPMIARMALPRLGGAPAVWNSAMLVYQALLLGGYAYAHAIGRFSVRRQAIIHVTVLALAALWLPIGLGAAMPPPDAAPEIWVPWLLLVSIGPLFFAVSAQAPLIQRWYNAASGGRDPYALYAASNLGSFGGLIAYPLVVEPGFALAGQSMVWTVGYVLLGLLVIGCALMLPRHQPTGAAAAEAVSEAPGTRRQLYWIVLAFVPSGLMLSTTTYLTTDIVAMPLLWVLPLGLYLLSFTVAFSTWRGFARTITFIAPLAIVAMALTIRNGAERPLFAAAVALILLFVVAVALHGEMYRTRPAAQRLTGFYLCMSIGGALGGVFAALIAPLIFDWTYEHPLLILVAGALVPQLFLAGFLQRLWADRRRAQFLSVAVILAVAGIAYLGIARPWQWLWHDGTTYAALAIGALAALSIGRRIPFLVALAGVLLVSGGWDSIQLSMKGDARTRSYFGVYTIRDYSDPDIRTLAHGTTFHGLQMLVPGEEREPTSYYGRNSGVGQALIQLPAIAGPGARVGIVGLGAGTLACYARPGQHWRFYEIDSAVVDIARDSGKFTFLSSCLPNVPILLGDARLNLARDPAASLDLLALDAFSSDVVPMHLLTREAFATYARVLAPKGVLVVHISNRFLDLEPVMAAAAAEGGWTAALLDDVETDDKIVTVLNNSVWVVLSRDPAVVGRVINAPGAVGDWRPLAPRRDFTPWTDDFSTILPLIIAWNPAPENHQ